MKECVGRDADRCIVSDRDRRRKRTPRRKCVDRLWDYKTHTHTCTHTHGVSKLAPGPSILWADACTAALSEKEET